MHGTALPSPHLTHACSLILQWLSAFLGQGYRTPVPGFSRLIWAGDDDDSRSADPPGGVEPGAVLDKEPCFNFLSWPTRFLLLTILFHTCRAAKSFPVLFISHPTKRSVKYR